VGALIAISAVSFLSRAAEPEPTPTPAQLQFFESKIRPIFANRCYKCHSHEATKLKGGLSLEYRETILKGGDTGPAIVPGQPEKSLLIKAVHYSDPDLQMPPKGEKLSDAEILALEQWVKMGAPDPRKAAASAPREWSKTERDHWSFQPVRKPPVPEVQAKDFIKTPVDNFIVAKLEAKEMKPNAVADKRTLLRRATFDLLGLPPTQKESDDFVADNSPEAFAKVVDRLLASPHYGERWGRYWLDLARYSDTKGDVKKQREDFHYPYAWTYRDYVIRSFNEDKPYNKFITEQIAADRTAHPDNSVLAALGFLTIGERFNNNENDIINDRIDVVTKGLMGLTVTCARCHDHKFDPVPTKDYYALHGVFASCVEPKDEPILPNKILYTPANVEFEKKYAALNAEMIAIERKGRGKGPAAKEAKKEANRIRSEMVDLELNHPGAPPRAMVLHDSTRPHDSPVFIRGEAENKGEIVPRHFLEILSDKTPIPLRVGSGRSELARAIASPTNPLTARTIINRIWQHHFGEGFVPTPDDLGNQSEPPSHPELLDYLAARFVEEGWSIKNMHRLIMLSHAYQQSSQNNPRYAQVDPNNRLLWRANVRRLDFEAVRDSILAIGGKLDLAMYGRPVNIGTAPYSMRRTIYGYIDRRNLPEIYNQFDFANPDVTMGKRYETVVPQQSLFMMNSPLVVEQARSLVRETKFAALKDAAERVRFLYAAIYQREPTDTEIKLGAGFVADSPAVDQPVRVPPVMSRPLPERQREKLKLREARTPFTALSAADRQPLGAWEKYAHALLQANETIFIN
jgi:mono/diheme cytochrome c family protein